MPAVSMILVCMVFWPVVSLWGLGESGAASILGTMESGQQDLGNGQLADTAVAREGSIGDGQKADGLARNDNRFSSTGVYAVNCDDVVADDETLRNKVVNKASSAHSGPAHKLRRSSWFMRRWRGRGIAYFAGLMCVVLCAAVLVLPSPYSIESPGPTQNVLTEVNGKPVIAVKGTKTYATRGKLLLTTVNARGVPGFPAVGAETLVAVFDPHQDLLPSEAVFPTGQTSEEYEKGADQQMRGSQDSASQAALAYANRLGIATKGVKVSMHVDDIGGPSAGMMYALGTVNKLTKQDETGGKTIAGTGTIDGKGAVGKIGGIRLKLLAAKRDGATWFLAPASNCNEVVGHVPQGLHDVKVSTLDEAYRALVRIGKGQGADLPHCVVSEGRSK
jgi:Lon-like protease